MADESVAAQISAPMSAIGIDPSLTGFAMCCIAADGSISETVLPKSPAACKSVGGRISRYRAHVNLAVEWLSANAARGPILIEGYSFGSSGTAVLTLAEFGCYLRVKLIASGFLPVEVAPSALKKFATGKGIGDKVAVAAALARRYDRDFNGGDNQSDAFGLAKLCACVLGMDEPQTDAQRKVTSDIMAALRLEEGSKPW